MRVLTRIAATVLAASIMAVVGASAGGVDGTVTNGTTGQPATVARINLMEVGRGLSTVDTLENVEGSFHFELDSAKPYLIQVESGGVIYSARVPPGGTNPVAITIFETTDDASLLRVEVPHLVVIVDGPKVYVSRVFEVHNSTSPPQTIVGEPGPFRFVLPESATVTRAMLTSATTTMPLRQEPVETMDDRGQTIAWPMKPGMTRYEIDYELPYAGAIELEEELFHGASILSAIVLPANLEVEIPGLVAGGVIERQGVEYRTYSGSDLPAGFNVSISLKGEGVAPTVPGSETERAAAPSRTAREGEIKAVKNRTGRGMLGILIPGVAAVILLLGSVSGAQRPVPLRPGRQRRAVNAAQSKLLDELAALDNRFSSDGIDEAEYRRLRADLKRQLAGSLATRSRKKKKA